MFSLPAENWWRLIIWLLVGLVIYFAYGRKHSVKNTTEHEIGKHGISPGGSLATDVDWRIQITRQEGWTLNCS
jgi:hypothetical protein